MRHKLFFTLLFLANTALAKTEPWIECSRCGQATLAIAKCKNAKKPEMNAVISDVMTRLDEMAVDITVGPDEMKTMMAWAAFECGKIDDFNALITKPVADKVVKLFPKAMTSEDLNKFIQSLPRNARTREKAIAKAIQILRKKSNIVISEHGMPEN